MNPYDMTVANTLSRIAAWVRGVLKIYRKPLLVLLAASATLAVGVNAGPASAPAGKPGGQPGELASFNR